MGLHLKEGDDDLAENHEINVTPLVDVMLVLLIVFMVAAPMMATGVKVDLPTANTKPLEEPKPPIVISIDTAGTVYVNENATRRWPMAASSRPWAP